MLSFAGCYQPMVRYTNLLRIRPPIVLLLLAQSKTRLRSEAWSNKKMERTCDSVGFFPVRESRTCHPPLIFVIGLFPASIMGLATPVAFVLGRSA